MRTGFSTNHKSGLGNLVIDRNGSRVAYGSDAFTLVSLSAEAVGDERAGRGSFHFSWALDGCDARS